jgi:hypothetical protein
MYKQRRLLVVFEHKRGKLCELFRPNTPSCVNGQKSRIKSRFDSCFFPTSI